VEWWHLHEKGSLVTYIHHDEQLCVDESNDKSDAKCDSSGFSEDEMEKTQTEELEKHKAWGSLQTPTKEASLTCPVKKKGKPEANYSQPHLLSGSDWCA
jgi:hypothetical protein